MKHPYVVIVVATWVGLPEFVGGDGLAAVRDAIQGAIGAALCIAIRPKSVREGFARLVVGLFSAFLFTGLACAKLGVDGTAFEDRSAVAGLIGFLSFAVGGVTATLLEKAEDSAQKNGWPWAINVFRVMRGARLAGDLQETEEETEAKK